MKQLEYPSKSGMTCFVDALGRQLMLLKALSGQPMFLIRTEVRVA